MSHEEELSKIFIDLPNDKTMTGESFWAKQVEENLYELRNSPFYAYDLHFLDIVKAVPDSPDQMSQIVEVVKRSGHKTLRVFFSKNITEPRQTKLLGQLGNFRANYERANTRLVAIDVPPEGDYRAVCDQLWAWEQEGILHYETGMTGNGTLL